MGPTWPFYTGSSKFAHYSGSGSMHECPFSGIPVYNISDHPPFTYCQNDGIVFHRAVRCDGCGVHPITGPRFKSKVKIGAPTDNKSAEVQGSNQVDGSVKKMQCGNVRGFNLNLPPPVSISISSPEINNVDPEEPMVKGHFLNPDSSSAMRKTVESVNKRPEVDLHTNIEREMKFTINDSLLVGSGAALSSVAPMDFSSVAHAAEHDPPLALFVASSQAALEVSNMVEAEEEMLLRELEEMRFNHVDLNKKVLRMNKYNLKQSVDYLCEVTHEWDMMLEELHKMGFGDPEMNKRLLKKNNGSIKRVVMDFIAGEKI